MHPLLTRQLAADFCLTEPEVLDGSHHFTVFEPRPDRRQYMEITPCILKIAVVRGKLLFTGRADVIARCRALYAIANAPWFMEAPNLAALNRELSTFGAQIRHSRPFFTADVLGAGKLPYYGTSISHLESQRVALNAGFRPAWFELVAAPEK